MISVIVCTYRRAAAVLRLLECVRKQTVREFEVLIVDGSGADSSVRDALAPKTGDINFRLLLSPPGLPRQRNAGLREARGEIICFLDDDVTFGPEFLETAAKILALPEMSDVRGITGVDVRSFREHIRFGLKLRRWLGLIPSLRPGDVDNLGRSVPLEIANPQVEYLETKWFPGCCQIYRRSALEGLAFDEELPTYGGEDLDFSMRVAQRGRLLLCGALRFEHHTDPAGRCSSVERMWQCGFGIGRRFARTARGGMDRLRVVRTCVAYWVLDLLTACRHFSRDQWRCCVARQTGLIAGWRSVNRACLAEGTVVGTRHKT